LVPLQMPCDCPWHVIRVIEPLICAFELCRVALADDMHVPVTCNTCSCLQRVTDMQVQSGYCTVQRALLIVNASWAQAYAIYVRLG